jgi:hypothetical protein
MALTTSGRGVHHTTTPFVAVINAPFEATEDDQDAIPALYAAFTLATRSRLTTKKTVSAAT